MLDVEHLRAIHLPHRCLITGDPIKHQDCILNFKSLLIAIDCDKCHPFFEEGRMRPDLLVLRKHNIRYEWFVIEIKRQLRKKAWHQVQSGLYIIEDNAEQFGDIGSYRPQGLLAYTYRRRVAPGRYGPLRQRDGTAVPLRVRKCGGETI